MATSPPLFRYGIEYETCLFVPLAIGPFKHESFPQFPYISHRQEIAQHLINRGLAAIAEGADSNSNQQEQSTWKVSTDISVLISFNLDFYRRLFSGIRLSSFDKIPSDSAFISALEIISPPLDYPAGNQTIKTFAESVNKCPFISYHNDNTSNHIHYSFPGHNLSEDPIKLFSVCMTWWYFEPILLKLVPYWRRNDNTYCTSFRVSLLEKYDSDKINNAEYMLEHLFANEFKFVFECVLFSNMMRYQEFQNNPTACKHKLVKDIIAFFQFGGEDSNCFPSKYKSLNMLNLVSGDPSPIGTLEVRLKHGSDDGEEINKYVELYGKILRKALDVNATNEFFSKTAPGGVSYRQILIKEDLDYNIHFGILCEYLGAENGPLLRYFHSRLPALATDEKTEKTTGTNSNTNTDTNTNSDTEEHDTLGPLKHPVFQPLQPLNGPQAAGKIKGKKKYTKTSEKVFLDKRYRTVYVGTRGAKYVKKNQEYKPLRFS